MGGAGWEVAAFSAFPPCTALPPLRTLLCRLPYVLVFVVPRCNTVGVCHRAGVGLGELMHFVFCKVFVLFFCILNDTKIMCVGKNHDRRVFFNLHVPRLSWWPHLTGAIGKCMWIIACKPNLWGQLPGYKSCRAFTYTMLCNGRGLLSSHPSFTLQNRRSSATTQPKRDL